MSPYLGTGRCGTTSRRGLLPEPDRSLAGYRRYTAETVGVVRSIKRAQDLGFALTDVKTLRHLADGEHRLPLWISVLHVLPGQSWRARRDSSPQHPDP